MISCDAIKIAYRQSKDGFVVSFTIHPQDMPADLANADIGSQWQLSLVPLDDDGNPETDGAPNQHAQCSGPSVRAGAAESGVAAPSRPSYTRDAGIACNGVVFQEFLKANGMLQDDMEPEKAAAIAVRLICGVRSRRDLFVDSNAGQRWRDLHRKYLDWQCANETYIPTFRSPAPRK